MCATAGYPDIPNFRASNVKCSAQRPHFIGAFQCFELFINQTVVWAFAYDTELKGIENRTETLKQNAHTRTSNLANIYSGIRIDRPKPTPAAAQSTNWSQTNSIYCSLCVFAKQHANAIEFPRPSPLAPSTPPARRLQPSRRRHQRHFHTCRPVLVRVCRACHRHSAGTQ